ncbi:hypothetical protein SK128_018683 [Halocaridina rubra]|uniref:Uncharacterized protein n=1 Tax=Halocaridina rubra TaxID=373956 RepID=A0AAN8XCJ4_HALRR
MNEKMPILAEENDREITIEEVQLALRAMNIEIPLTKSEICVAKTREVPLLFVLQERPPQDPYVN